MAFFIQFTASTIDTSLFESLVGDLQNQLTQGQLDAFFPDGFGDILADPEAGLETLRNIQEGRKFEILSVLQISLKINPKIFFTSF